MEQKLGHVRFVGRNDLTLSFPGEFRHWLAESPLGRLGRLETRTMEYESLSLGTIPRRRIFVMTPVEVELKSACGHR